MGENVGNSGVMGACLVFVETRDKANNDSSAGWARKVEAMGGKVANKLSDKVTHVVFKGGKKTVRAGATTARAIDQWAAHTCLSPLASRLCSRMPPRLSARAWQTWDAATGKGIPLVSPMWVSTAEADEECAEASDHPAVMPAPSDVPQKSMEPVPVRHQEPPESSSQVSPLTHSPLTPRALLRPSLLSLRLLHPSLLHPSLLHPSLLHPSLLARTLPPAALHPTDRPRRAAAAIPGDFAQPWRQGGHPGAAHVAQGH